MYRSLLRSSAFALVLGFLSSTPAGALTPNGRLQIIHMDVGQGDGTVIITPLGQVAMIDCGVYNNTQTVVNQLAALGVTDVALHFASHYHADHIGSIFQITHSMPPVTIQAAWDRGESYSSATYNTYAGTIDSVRHTLVKDQIFTLDAASDHPVTIKCVDLLGAGVSTSDENAKSVVLKVSYGSFDEVFGGDLTGTFDHGGDIESVVGPEVGPVEVYKVHHHGSKYSSTDNFLTPTKPKVAVIQVGDGNSYGHPTADAVFRLHYHGARAYWTETGAGATPNRLDRIAHGQVIIQATWEPGGVDTVRGPNFTHVFTNSNTGPELIPPFVTLSTPLGGEIWDGGTTRQVKFHATDNVGVDSINVDYSVHGFDGPWLPIVHGLPAGTDSIGWLVPDEPTDSAMVRVTAFDASLNNNWDFSDGIFEIRPESATGVMAGRGAGLSLARPAPNPSFGPVTLNFTMARPGRARIDIVDVNGRRAWSWEAASLGAGPHSTVWDGHMRSGERAGVGVYWVHLIGENEARSVKMVRLN